MSEKNHRPTWVVIPNAPGGLAVVPGDQIPTGVDLVGATWCHEGEPWQRLESEDLARLQAGRKRARKRHDTHDRLNVL